jgi:hypothetical protein
MEDAQEIFNCHGKVSRAFYVNVAVGDAPGRLFLCCAKLDRRSANVAMMPPLTRPAICFLWRNRSFTFYYPPARIAPRFHPE